MATKCSGCGENIFNICFMECSKEKCKKMYDLKCLALKLEVFESFSEEYKAEWICPECVCANPKSSNLDTPVRGNTTPTMNRTFTTNVNTRRGNCIDSPMAVAGAGASTVTTSVNTQSNATATEVGTDITTVILNELRAFRSDVMNRLESQAKDMHLLKIAVEQTKNIIKTLIPDFYKMTVVEEKCKGIEDIENKIADLTKMQNECQQKTESHLMSFAEAIKQNVDNSDSNMIRNVNKGGATKSAVILPTVVEGGPEQTIESGERENGDNNWKIVKNKKEKRQSKDVKKGQSTTISSIKATEPKKHLHVWRLHPETSSEDLIKHVRKVCETEPTVEKITHKTQRDYSSFRITVPESVYSQLCQPEIWPVNTEFSEWIWFRKSTNKTNKPKNN